MLPDEKPILGILIGKKLSGNSYIYFMNLIIQIKDKKIGLVLKEDEQFADEFFWEEERNLSQRLLVEIDNLLQRNDLKPKDLSEVKVKTNIDDKFTTVRIAKVVANTFNKFKK